MQRNVVSAPDPWRNLPSVGEPGTAVGSPRPVRLTPGERTHVAVIWGQSNSAQWGYGKPYVPGPKVEVFNWKDGGMYHAVEPLPGAQISVAAGAVSGFAPRLGDKLIAAGYCDRFIAIVCGVGGTSTYDWAAGGFCATRIPAVIARMKAAGLAPSVLIRHQGEADPPLGTSRFVYRDRARAEVQIFREAEWDAPALIALATYWEGVNMPGSPAVGEVRNGQVMACSAELNIFQGPDTDILGATYRGDTAHLNELGLDLHAGMLVPPIATHAVPFQ